MVSVVNLATSKSGDNKQIFFWDSYSTAQIFFYKYECIIAGLGEICIIINI